MMGGGEIIASFLDEGAIDDFIISVIPKFIGEGVPLIAHRHRHVPLRLQSVRRFLDGVVQVHYQVGTHEGFEEAGANRHRSRRQTVLGNVGKG
jgi:dihydrofolate reductase